MLPSKIPRNVIPSFQDIPELSSSDDDSAVEKEGSGMLPSKMPRNLIPSFQPIPELSCDYDDSSVDEDGSDVCSTCTQPPSRPLTPQEAIVTPISQTSTANCTLNKSGHSVMDADDLDRKPPARQSYSDEDEEEFAKERGNSSFPVEASPESTIRKRSAEESKKRSEDDVISISSSSDYESPMRSKEIPNSTKSKKVSPKQSNPRLPSWRKTAMKNSNNASILNKDPPPVPTRTRKQPARKCSLAAYSSSASSSEDESFQVLKSRKVSEVRKQPTKVQKQPPRQYYHGDSSSSSSVEELFPAYRTTKSTKSSVRPKRAAQVRKSANPVTVKARPRGTRKQAVESSDDEWTGPPKRKSTSRNQGQRRKLPVSKLQLEEQQLEKKPSARSKRKQAAARGASAMEKSKKPKSTKHAERAKDHSSQSEDEISLDSDCSSIPIVEGLELDEAMRRDVELECERIKERLGYSTKR